METLNVTCAHCATVNRVPKDRAIEQAICGHCKQQLISYRPVTVTEKNFDAIVMKSDLPVVLDFWASWCGPCVQFSPVFEQAASGWEPRARFVKVDADATPALSQRLGIRSIPTIILFHKGKEVERRSGAMPPQMFDQWLEQKISSI
ncbi:MAG: thioredoxin TrxC [Reinekea sp.]|jgi:thioredoxin 2